MCGVVCVCTYMLAHLTVYVYTHAYCNKLESLLVTNLRYFFKLSTKHFQLVSFSAKVKMSKQLCSCMSQLPPQKIITIILIILVHTYRHGNPSTCVQQHISQCIFHCYWCNTQNEGEKDRKPRCEPLYTPAPKTQYEYEGTDSVIREGSI